MNLNIFGIVQSIAVLILIEAEIISSLMNLRLCRLALAYLTLFNSFVTVWHEKMFPVQSVHFLLQTWK